MKSFVLVSEEAISKGIRRIVALTGPEALKAEKKCNALEERVENIQNLVQQKMKEGGLKIKETSQEISRIGEVSFFLVFVQWHALKFVSRNVSLEEGASLLLLLIVINMMY